VQKGVASVPLPALVLLAGLQYEARLSTYMSVDVVAADALSGDPATTPMMTAPPAAAVASTWNT
jgi:hypothetical protein